MRNQGFTLIEFTIVMAIVVILVSIASPSIINFLGNSDLRSSAASITGDLGTARAEALRTRQAVSVCPKTSTTANSCGTDWTNGWVVFQDTNNNQQVDTGERIVRSQEGLDGSSTITGPANFVFRSSGTVAIVGTIQVRNSKATSGRDIQVIQGGRVMSTVVNP
jgi:type IV fimbrial biogenesis protein FimT